MVAHRDRDLNSGPTYSSKPSAVPLSYPSYKQTLVYRWFIRWDIYHVQLDRTGR